MFNFINDYIIDGQIHDPIQMPKIMPDYREEVRKRIVTAGFEVMCEKGYAQTTMDDIAGRLGVSKPAIYRYFRTKDELIVESSKNFSKLFVEKAKTLPPASGPLDAWNLLFDLYIDFDENVFALYFELLSMVKRNPQISKNATENLKEGMSMSTQRIEGYKRKAMIPDTVDPSTVALASMSLFLGMRALILLGIERTEIRNRWEDIGRSLYGMPARD